MLDTISLKIQLISPIGEPIEREVMNVIEKIIKELNYCDLTFKDDNSINLKLSYPRYFYPTNAYLISNPNECLSVNANLIEKIRANFMNNLLLLSYFEEGVEFILTRVDVAFTHYMDACMNFNSYRNLYYILNSIYCSINKTSIPKKIGTVENEICETVIFTENSNTSSYNNRVIIYDQDKKMSDYYEINQPTLYQKMIGDFPDLSQRMRIEGAKRIRRKGFLAEEWKNFDIYRCYVPKIGNYILSNLFNIGIANNNKILKIQELKTLLLQERQYPNFSYQSFVYRYQLQIWDYELLRQAIMELFSNNPNTGYHACSTVRGVLENLQSTNGIKYFNVFDELEEIRQIILKGIKGAM